MGSTHDVEFEMVRKNGNRVYVSFEGRVSYDENGQFSQTHCLLTDITEKRRLEAQLRQAQKMQAIGTLAGGIAHDFNNILGSILGYNEFALEETKENAKVQRYLQHVHVASIRARNLVAQLLTFSRQSEERLTPLKIAPLVEEVKNLLRSAIPMNIDITVKINAPDAMVNANATGIHQILMNLCSNAAAAMAESGGHIDIDLETVHPTREEIGQKEIQPGHFLRLSVADDGPGIPAEYLSQIFDPFFTTKEIGRGTGLGLSVVHGIVQSHAGFIQVETTAGKGTTFKIHLPQISPDGPAGDMDVAVPARIPAAERTVLLVDDEPQLVEMVEKQLQDLGFSVISTTDPRQALERFSTEADRIDLVVTDQAMPHLTGIDLAKKIFAIRSGVPVLLCTGYSQTVSPEKAKKNGVNEILMKPFLKNDLANALDRLLSERGTDGPNSGD